MPSEDQAPHKLLETKNYLIHWQDTEHTILVLDVRGEWDWEQAFAALAHFNQTLYDTPYPTYSLLKFREGTNIVPSGLTLPNVRDLMAMHPPLEQLVILVNAGTFIQSMIQTASRTYGLRAIFGRYRFVNTLDEALQLIQSHRQQRG